MYVGIFQYNLRRSTRWNFSPSWRSKGLQTLDYNDNLTSAKVMKTYMLDGKEINTLALKNT